MPRRPSASLACTWLSLAILLWPQSAALAIEGGALARKGDAVARATVTIGTLVD